MLLGGLGGLLIKCMITVHAVGWLEVEILHFKMSHDSVKCKMYSSTGIKNELSAVFLICLSPSNFFSLRRAFLIFSKFYFDSKESLPLKLPIYFSTTCTF